MKIVSIFFIHFSINKMCSKVLFTTSKVENDRQTNILVLNFITYFIQLYYLQTKTKLSLSRTVNFKKSRKHFDLAKIYYFEFLLVSRLSFKKVMLYKVLVIETVTEQIRTIRNYEPNNGHYRRNWCKFGCNQRRSSATLLL